MGMVLVFRHPSKFQRPKTIALELIELLGEMGVELGGRRGGDSEDGLRCGIGRRERSRSGGLWTGRTPSFGFVCDVRAVNMSYT